MRRTLHNSENETRQANLSLMQQKKRKMLEEQLENKMQLLSQYSNTRGIGMKGATVPQRDIDLLNQQIGDIRSQLAEFNPGGNTNTNTNTNTNEGRMLQQQQSRPMGAAPTPFQQQQQQQMAQGGQAPAKSKRDEVWEKKYAQWKQRNQVGGGGAQNENALAQPAQQQQQQLPWLPTAQPPQQPAAQQNQQQQPPPQQQQQFAPQSQSQPQGQSEQPRYGRRAPSFSEGSTPRQATPAQPQQQQQQQQQQAQPVQQPQLSVTQQSRRQNTRSTGFW